MFVLLTFFDLYNGWPCKDVESFKATFSEAVLCLRFSKMYMQIYLLLLLFSYLGFGEDRRHKGVDFCTKF